MPTFYEFFAGGGMVRAGLGPSWSCLFANDNDPKKASAYKRNWGGAEICGKDVHCVSAGEIPGVADLAWASFPCQDLSLAGAGAGLKGARSGTFWAFWRLMKDLAAEGRPQKMIVLENVCGALTSRNGCDFRSLCEALIQQGYRCGAVVVDAALFVPQSRPRLFVIAVRGAGRIDDALIADRPQRPFHTTALRTAHQSLPRAARAFWAWWKLPPPPPRALTFADIVEEPPSGVSWHTGQQTERLLSLMSPLHLAKVENAKRANRLFIGTLYKRRRRDAAGVGAQRAEVRFDGVAGCLRTPNGGSSRQTIIIVRDGQVQSRLLSPRETARLMGLPDHYALPENYNEAYRLTGDGVVAPAVRHLAQYLIEPLLSSH